MPKMTRTFIAVALPEDRAAKLGHLQALIAPEVPGVRWVDPANLHATLAFLGDVADTDLAEVCRAVAEAAAGFAAIELRLEGLGAFPDARRPRTLWVGLTGRFWVMAVQLGVVMVVGLQGGYEWVQWQADPVRKERILAALPWFAGGAVVLKLLAAGWAFHELVRRGEVTADESAKGSSKDRLTRSSAVSRSSVASWWMWSTPSASAVTAAAASSFFVSSANPRVIASGGGTIIWVIFDSTRLESMPPDRNAPRRTSLCRR